MKITRRGLLVASLTAPIASIFAAATPENFTYELNPEQVGDGIWMVHGADEAIHYKNGGAIANITIIDSPEGTILIDCGPSHRYSNALKQVAEELTGKPVIRVYITHLHPDHGFGIDVFGANKTAALAGTIAGMKRDQEGFSDAMYRLLGDWMRGTNPLLPAITATEGVEDFGGRKLRLLALNGHSQADLAILDEQTGILATGDLVFYDRAPTTPTADIAEWQDSLNTLAKLDHKSVIPGHGPFDANGQTAIAQTADWLSWIEQVIAEAVESGLDMVEAGKIAIPDRFSKVTMARYELQRSVSHFYPALEAQLFPRIN